MSSYRLLKEDARDTLLQSMVTIGAYQRDMQKTLGKTSAQKKHDGSVVTDVDKESQNRLTEILAHISPYPVLGEENKHEVNANIMNSTSPIWVVDPLDGTKSYSEGYDEFGINVALLDKPGTTGNRHAVFGAVYFPAKGELFYTLPHGPSCIVQVKDGHFGEPQLLQCNKELKETSPIKIAMGYRDGIRHEKNAQGLETTHHDNGLSRFAESGHIMATSKHTGGYRTARVLKDGYHAAIFNMPAAIWDIAALDALMRGAGGHMYSLHANGSISDTPYFGADASRYHDGKLFSNPPYLCMHSRMLRELANVGPLVADGASYQR